MMSGTVDGSIRRVNQRMCEILGYSPEEICALGPATISHPDDLQQDMAMFARLAAREITHYTIEKRCLRKDGGQIWVQLTLSNRIEDDQIVEVLGALQDITDRKLAEEQLSLSRDIIANISEGVLIVRAGDGLIIAANRALESMLGWAKNELVGQHVSVVNEAFALDVGAGDDVGNEADHRKPRVGELVCSREGGDSLRLEATVAALPLKSSRQAELWVSIYRDVSGRKQAEEALRQSEERLRLSLAAAGQGFYDLDLVTGEAQVSPEYAVMIGEDPETFHETNARWAERMHPEDRANVYAIFEAYVRGDIGHYEVEFRQRTKTGGWLWTLSIGSILGRDADGKPLRMLGTHTNIDARKRTEQDLADKNAQLRAIVAGTSDGILMVDRETQRLTFASPAICQQRCILSSTYSPR